jgi:hypothetical protein
MLLEGSCHCAAVRFSLQSHTPVPFMRCYCSICRKTAGGGGYAVNIMGLADSLTVLGKEHLQVYRAKLESGGESSGERHFCGICGSALWMSDPRWPELVHPFASAIDTPLPPPPEQVYMLEAYRPAWADAPASPADGHFPEFPDESIQDWHEKRGLLTED